MKMKRIKPLTSHTPRPFRLASATGTLDTNCDPWAIANATHKMALCSASGKVLVLISTSKFRAQKARLKPPKKEPRRCQRVENRRVAMRLWHKYFRKGFVA